MSAVRVLFVIPGAARGNSMIFARRQAASLRDAGVEVSLFHLRSRTSLVRMAREWVRFRRRVRRIHPHIIHAHFGTVTAMFAALAAPMLPLVVTFYGGDLNPASRQAAGSERTRAFLGRVLSQLAALRAARTICVSGQLRERLWWRRRNTLVLPTGVDQRVFAPEPQARARERLGWTASERVVLFNAGRDARIKRLDLARAAVELARPLVAGLRLEVLDGGTAPERIPTFMNAADCLLLTSDSEGSPTVIQEALACNLPVVSVDAGDVVERLRGVGRAQIVARDPAAIASALAAMLAAPGRSDGRRKLAEFSASHIAGELRRVYGELTGPGMASVAGAAG